MQTQPVSIVLGAGFQYLSQAGKLAGMIHVDELAPGLYKVIKYRYFHGRKRKTSAHLLRIEGTGEQRKVYFDHSLHPIDMENFQNLQASDFEVVGRINHKPVVHHARVSLSFHDRAEDEFKLSARSLQELREIFDLYPWLKEPFQYVRRSQRTKQ